MMSLISLKKKLVNFKIIAKWSCLLKSKSDLTPPPAQEVEHRVWDSLNIFCKFCKQSEMFSSAKKINFLRQTVSAIQKVTKSFFF